MAATRAQLHIAVIACVFLAGFAYGSLAAQHGLFPHPQIKRLKAHLVMRFAPPPLGFHDTRGREPVACGDLVGDTAVLLAFGQSNSANHGLERHRPGPGVYNFNLHDGRCYRARDPLLGATETGGSVWTRLADLLIAAGHHRRVLIAPVGVGGSSIRRWVPGGDLADRVPRAVAGLRAQGLRVSHMVWHQGEQDTFEGMDRRSYVDHFGRLVAAVRGLGVEAPIYVAVASLCHNDGSAAIRAAQRALPDLFAGVRRGPDTDTLDRVADRYDGCHFSGPGMVRHARLWFDALTAPVP